MLPPVAHTSGKYRSYGSAEVSRLSFIPRARALGFALQQVRNLLERADDRDRPCAEVDALARTQLKQVDEKISDLKALRLELSGLSLNVNTAPSRSAVSWRRWDRREQRLHDRFV